MTQPPPFQAIDDIQRWVLESLLSEGALSYPRGMKTLEIFPVAVTLLNPRNRCITNVARRWKFPAAVGEFAWHVSGSKDLSFIAYYLDKWREIVGDSLMVNGSCYGHKIFGSRVEGLNQWERLLSLLRTDPDSRRGVLVVGGDRVDLEPANPDAPCASSLHFLLRSGRVHLTVYMRSNDSIWGLPYDIFLFTMLQELLACELGLQLGAYTHVVGSMHLYERHFDLAKKIVCSSSEEFEMPPMQAHWQLGLFLEQERRLREGNKPESRDLHPYWADLIAVLRWHRQIKLNERAQYQALALNTYKALLEAA